MKPERIEEESFRIIDELTSVEQMRESAEWQVIRRMIHASGDVDIANTACLSTGALTAAFSAFEEKLPIICDVTMVVSGLSKQIKSNHEVLCFINDSAVAENAAKYGTTRAKQAVLHALEKYEKAVYIVGNAPTALLEIVAQSVSREFTPLVVGIPVGFVMAKESKEMLAASGLNYVTNTGNKGGSAMAAAALNALYKLYKTE